MSIIKGKGQRLIPEELLKYLQNQKDNGMNLTQLVDSKGNPRFVEGNGVGLTKEGVTISYCKWSLSGTHLMVVCAGTITNGTVIDNATALANYTIPDYIYNKIYPVWADVRIETKNTVFLAGTWTTQTTGLTLTKRPTSLEINFTSGGFTLTDTRSFRVQFDLLIDSE